VAGLRAELTSKFGDWYVLHTYSGMENRVKQNLENRVKALNMETSSSSRRAHRGDGRDP